MICMIIIPCVSYDINTVFNPHSDLNTKMFLFNMYMQFCTYEYLIITDESCDSYSVHFPVWYKVIRISLNVGYNWVNLTEESVM